VNPSAVAGLGQEFEHLALKECIFETGLLMGETDRTVAGFVVRLS